MKFKVQFKSSNTLFDVYETVWVPERRSKSGTYLEEAGLHFIGTYDKDSKDFKWNPTFRSIPIGNFVGVEDD